MEEQLTFDADEAIADLCQQLAAALAEVAKLRSIIKRDIVARAQAAAPDAPAKTAPR